MENTLTKKKENSFDEFRKFCKKETEAKEQYAIFPIDLIEFAKDRKDCLILTFYQFGFSKRTKTKPSHPIWNLNYEFKGKFYSFEGTWEKIVEIFNKANNEIAIKNNLVMVQRGGGLGCDGKIYCTSIEQQDAFVKSYMDSIGKSHLKPVLYNYETGDHLNSLVKQLWKQ